MGVDLASYRARIGTFIRVKFLKPLKKTFFSTSFVLYVFSHIYMIMFPFSLFSALFFASLYQFFFLLFFYFSLLFLFAIFFVLFYMLLLLDVSASFFGVIL